ncbi:DUF4232 domain-containing protein [Streptomyces sp. M41]|uniref:DUF4232 domain-containing protein n=1 Tax=Streptomyces sp. M41 TaxID=3059412 RepID=UPI00374D32AF
MSATRNTRTRLVGAAAAVVIAALSMTACDNGTGVNDEGASAGATPTTSSSTGSNDSEASAGSSSSSMSGGTSASGGQEQDPTAGTTATKRPASSAKPVTCEGSNTKTVAAPLNRPLNHMLLTVTNTGSAPCHLYTYPAVRFGEAQSVPPVIEESKPQAVVTLDPGESGYAAVVLAAADGSGANGRTEKSLAVYYHGRSGNESVGKGANPSLPAEGVHIDDSLKVTYWQQSMDDALTW